LRRQLQKSRKSSFPASTWRKSRPPTSKHIETDAPLFGEGLGLDSIDALELGMAVKKEFGISFSKNPADNKQIFHSVKTLADYVLASRQG